MTCHYIHFGTHQTVGSLQITSSFTVPRHCPLQVAELSESLSDSPLLQHRHRVLLYLPQSDTATQGHVTALGALNSWVPAQLPAHFGSHEAEFGTALHCLIA